MKALIEQFAAMVGPNGHRCQPNPCGVEEEDKSSIERENLSTFLRSTEHGRSTPWHKLTLIDGRPDSSSIS
jgi:hypothetical protein